MPEQIHIGKRIQAALRDKRIKPIEYAEFMGKKTKQAFYDLEKRKDVGINELLQVCELLKLDISYFTNAVYQKPESTKTAPHYQMEENILGVLKQIEINTRK